ncbi:hypothetical protein L837_3831 [Mycobacterium avium MAV_061107_1842]|nr:hypothetical protein L837_3831 [Mycobacterium avium MAV_061107_1842]
MARAVRSGGRPNERPRGGPDGFGGAQRRGDAGGDLRGRVGWRGRIGAEGGDLAANPVQRVEHVGGVRVGADSSADPGGGRVVEHAGLQVGEQLGGQRRVGFRVAVIRRVVARCSHRTQCPSWPQ